MLDKDYTPLRGGIGGNSYRLQLLRFLYQVYLAQFLLSLRDGGVFWCECVHDERNTTDGETYYGDLSVSRGLGHRHRVLCRRRCGKTLQRLPKLDEGTGES